MMRREGTSSESRCQDCGNQAKRDCEHSRCRTCCKSRSLECQTHVKSTWIPVASRRPRHLAMHHRNPLLLHHQHSPPNPKRCRQTPRPLGFEEDNFPAEMRLPAVFRCVRVSSADNAVDEYAYQTSVSIGGHIFAGVLYDQGPDPAGSGSYVAGESSSSAAAGLFEQPYFAARTTAAPAATGTASSFASPFLPFTNATSHLFHHPKT